MQTLTTVPILTPILFQNSRSATEENGCGRAVTVKFHK